MRELAERSLLQGQTGAYVSTADVSEAKVPAILEATIAARIDPLNMLDVETVARWPDHPDHRAVATEWRAPASPQRRKSPGAARPASVT